MIVTSNPDRRFVIEFLDRRLPASGPMPAHVGMGGTRHRRGSVTDAQQELHDFVVEHYGGHDTYVANDGSMHLTRPGKPAQAGTSASIITGAQGDAILTVYSPHWLPIGPVNGEASRSWMLVHDADGTAHLEPAHLDPLGGVTFNPTPLPPSNGHVDTPVSGIPTIQFRDLPDPFVVPPITWHAERLLCRETHGELAGAEKTLKSYTGLAIDVGLAAGVDVLGYFPVEERQRVLVLVGEGGEGPFLRRLVEVCSGYGIGPDDVRGWLRYTTDHASASSLRFLDGIRAELETFGPALVHADPWYSYQPGATDSSQLASVGATLEMAGELCRAGGATAWFNHHFNRTANGGLRQITGAGHAEWVDSWMLSSHRLPPNLAAGQYQLRLDVGSRQWGGASYDVDYTITPDLGKMIWTVAPHVEVAVDPAAEPVDRLAYYKLELARVGRQMKRAQAKTAWVDRCTGDQKKLRSAFDDMITTGDIVPSPTIPRAFELALRTR